MALRKGENPYIYGMHDRGGEHLMMVNGQARGWVLVTEAIGSNPNDQGRSNYQDLADKGLGVIVRLNNAYGKDGTIPHSSQYDNFARRVANFVRNSPGASIWLIGNEMNLEREQPRNERITPRLYAECYKKCRAAIKALPGHERDTVVVGAIGPWNGETPYDADPQGKYGANKIPGAPGDYPYNGFFGDFIKYMRDMLAAIGPENCDAIAIHAYSHGYNPDLVFSDGKMGPPFQKYHFHFRTYRDQMAAIPESMRHLPVYLTEANGDREPNGATWPFGNNGWIKNAYKEINDWNKTRGNQQIRCMILFRWIIDPHGWSIDGKPEVQQDFKEAITRNYQWNQAVVERGEVTVTPPVEPPIIIPTTTGIRIQDISASLPTNGNQPPYPRRDRANIRRFIIHHTVTPATVPVERVASFQVSNRNLPAISYHFCTTAQGEVYQTQPLEVASKHAGDHSADSVGVCLIGNFSSDPPPEAQLSATAALLAHLAGQLKIEAKANTIQGYRELAGTQSPGNTWPTWKEPLITAVGNLLAGDAAAPVITTPPVEIPPEPTEPEPTPTAPQAPPYQARFITHNIPKIAAAGQNLTVNLTIQNTGSFTWVKDGPNPFRLGFRWFDSAGQMVALPAELDFRTPLPVDIPPNRSISLRAMLRTPEAPGDYRLQWDMVHELITWFSTQGDPGLVVDGITINLAVAPQPIPAAQIVDVRATLATNPSLPAYQRRARQAIRRFIIHHTATTPNITVQRIAEFQTQRQNKPGIAYHFCVTAQGQLYQTQPLEVVSSHAGQHSADSIGVCLLGNFTHTPPPEAQLKAAAALLAQVAGELQLTLSSTNVLGHRELVNTQSPGDTWPAWKNTLVSQAQTIQTGAPAGPTPAPTAYPKVIEHYLLLWHRSPGNWAERDLVSAIDYIGQFQPVVGFSVKEAKHARYVTIVGGPAGVPGDSEQILRAAGCHVERLSGRTQEETNQMLDDLAAQGRRFRTLQ